MGAYCCSLGEPSHPRSPVTLELSIQMFQGNDRKRKISFHKFNPSTSILSQVLGPRDLFIKMTSEDPTEVEKP